MLKTRTGPHPCIGPCAPDAPPPSNVFSTRGATQRSETNQAPRPFTLRSKTRGEVEAARKRRRRPNVRFSRHFLRGESAWLSRMETEGRYFSGQRVIRFDR